MKVLKLNEASSTDIANAKKEFNDAKDRDEKLEVLETFLKNCGLNDNAWDHLKDFGSDFLFNWMNSFKWEEAGRSNNEFMALMNNPSADHVLSNKNRFIKAYNTYASDCINSTDELYDNPILTTSIYNYPIEDIKEIVNYWSQDFNKLNDGANDEDFDNMIKKYYEDDGNVKTLAEIKQYANNSGLKNSNDQNIKELQRLLSNKDYAKIAKEILSRSKDEAGNIQ